VAVLTPDAPAYAGAFDLLTELADAVLSFEDATLSSEPSVRTRYYGVGPDLATLSSEALTRSGQTTQTLEGTVDAADGPVARAWVVVRRDGAPYTLGTSGDDGTFAIDVPNDGATYTTQAVGRVRGRFYDRSTLDGHYSAYANEAARQAALDQLAGEGLPAAAEGRGVGSDEAPLTLGVPARVTVDLAGDDPYRAHFTFTEGGDSIDEASVLRRTNGLAAGAWSGGGPVEVLVEPGTYNVLTFQGGRGGYSQTTVTLEAGDNPPLTLPPLEGGFETPGWIIADPHTHAAPSGDANITMAERLLVQTASGVQVHFGTDHDHFADYRPLVRALGLDGQLKSALANEVSPPVRGHFNVYPLPSALDGPNGGAWRWWAEFPESTDALFQTLRERFGEDVILQVNHPTDSGMAQMARWSPGKVERGNTWSTRFDAIEVLNAGEHEEFVPFFRDMWRHGNQPLAIGVSDSHRHEAGNEGFSFTYLYVGDTEVADLSDDALEQAMREGGLIASTGPFLDMSVRPGSLISSATTLDVSVLAGPTAQIASVQLWANGELVASNDDTEASFELNPSEDTFYVVMAQGSGNMRPISGEVPWAMSQPIRFDVGGDGWTAPQPPLVPEED